MLSYTNMKIYNTLIDSLLLRKKESYFILTIHYISVFQSIKRIMLLPIAARYCQVAATRLRMNKRLAIGNWQ